MKYKEILNSREKQRFKIEELKLKRDTLNNDITINDKIKKEKFKYKVYNALLKGGKK